MIALCFANQTIVFCLGFPDKKQFKIKLERTQWWNVIGGTNFGQILSQFCDF